MKTGDKVWINCDGRTVEGVVILASESQVSLMLGFEAILDGHVCKMPVLLRDGVYRTLITGQEVTVTPRIDGDHRLVDDTLTREHDGILARCTCGWSSRAHFSSMAASVAFRYHAEQATKS